MDAYSKAHWMYSESHSIVELKEYFFVMYLNQGNEIIGYLKLSEGGIAGTVADTRLAFATGLKCLATGIILVHNHPSGNLKPSKTDCSLTKQFKEAGKLLDIQVLDHLILTQKDYYSFADDGLL